MAATANPAGTATELDDAEGAEAERPKRRLPIKMLIIGAAALAVVGGGAFAALKMFQGSQQAQPDAPATKPAIFVDIPEVLVNLSNGKADRTQYLKVKIVLEVPDQSVAQQIQPLMPRIIDTFQTYLRELRPSDLDGSAGLFRLREELTRRVNAALSSGRIKAVLFKEIVIQ